MLGQPAAAAATTFNVKTTFKKQLAPPLNRVHLKLKEAMKIKQSYNAVF